MTSILYAPHTRAEIMYTRHTLATIYVEGNCLKGNKSSAATTAVWCGVINLRIGLKSTCWLTSTFANVKSGYSGWDLVWSKIARSDTHPLILLSTFEMLFWTIPESINSHHTCLWADDPFFLALDQTRWVIGIHRVHFNRAEGDYEKLSLKFRVVSLKRADETWLPTIRAKSLMETETREIFNHCHTCQKNIKICKRCREIRSITSSKTTFTTFNETSNGKCVKCPQIVRWHECIYTQCIYQPGMYVTC